MNKTMLTENKQKERKAEIIPTMKDCSHDRIITRLLLFLVDVSTSLSSHGRTVHNRMALHGVQQSGLLLI